MVEQLDLQTKQEGSGVKNKPLSNYLYEVRPTPAMQKAFGVFGEYLPDIPLKSSQDERLPLQAKAPDQMRALF